MGFESLKAEVCRANKDIVQAGLVLMTWGNVSGVDRDAGVVAIKPSGVDYDKLQPEDIVILSLETGETLEGNLKPSSDTPTHLLLYREFESIGGVVHTHSTCATTWAQAGCEIPCLGTTHADYFFGPVPVTRKLTTEEIENDYEANTGRVIVERFKPDDISVETTQAVLVNGHGPFVWGKDARDAVENSIVLEEMAAMGLMTMSVDPDTESIPDDLLDKHFLRKHGPDAYYGQKSATISDLKKVLTSGLASPETAERILHARKSSNSRKNRFRRAAVIIVTTAVCVLIAVGALRLLSIAPDPLEPPVGAPESLHEMLDCDSQEGRLAAAVILASNGDEQGTKFLLDSFPRLSGTVHEALLDYLYRNADREKISHELVDVFLRRRTTTALNGNPIRELSLIPPGKEEEHSERLRTLVFMIADIMGSSTEHEFLTDLSFNMTMDKLVAARKRDVLLELGQILKEQYSHLQKVSSPSKWAALILAIHEDNPLNAIDYISSLPPGLRESMVVTYLNHLGDMGLGSRVTELWFRKGISRRVRNSLSRTIAIAWYDLPKESKSLFSADDQEYFILENARYCEKNNLPITREAFLRLAGKPSGHIINSFRNRIKAGDDDIREIACLKARTSIDPDRIYDSLLLLKKDLGGIPEDVEKGIRTYANSVSELDRVARGKQLLVELLDRPLREAASIEKNCPYRDYEIPWVFRKDRIAKALTELRELLDAITNYRTTMGKSPASLAELIDTSVFLSEVPPDVCAPSGPYVYWGSEDFSAAVSSTGPDGVRDVSLQHHAVYRRLRGDYENANVDEIYVRWTPSGYTYSAEYSDGCDIVLSLD